MPYKTISKIASGTFGTVYKVQESTNGELYALKLIHENYKTPKELKRIKRGFETAQKVSHPNCVKMIEWYEDKNEIGFVMEFVETIDVLAQSEAINENSKSENLTKNQNLTGKISKIIQITNGLEALHQKGIVHRDLKPANILEAKSGKIKITDFDLVKIDNASTMTGSGDFLGTVKYSSPEQCKNSGQIDFRSDLYSVGIIFYEMLTGVLPVKGESLGEIALAHLRSPIISPRQIIHELPKPIETIVMRLLEKDPNDRIQSAAEISRTLNDFLQEGSFEEIGISKNYLLPPVFVSRKEELKTLEKTFKESSNGSLKNIFISGELGIGKTRLWEEFKVGLSSQNTFLLETQFLDSNISLEPLSKFVSKALASISNISDKEKIEILGNFAWDLVKIYPPLSQMPFMKKIEKADELQGTNSEFRLFETLLNLLKNVSNKKTLILHFENLQWIDDLSSKFLLYAMRTLKETACLIVGSFRNLAKENTTFTNAKNEILQKHNPIQIELKTISVKEIVQILTSIFGKSDPVETKFAEFIFSKTKGNPLFIQEVIYNFYGKNLLTNENGNWDLNLEKISKVEISENIFSVLNERLKFLENETLETLQVASLIGMHFTPNTLCSVLKTSAQKIIENLEIAKSLNFVEKNGEKFNFINDSVRETLEKNLNPDSKKTFHKKIAELLEKDFEANKVEVIEELANHFYLGEVVEKAIEYSIEAVEVLSRRYSPSKALNYLNNAIELLEESDDVTKLIDCKIRKSELLLSLGQSKDAETYCKETLLLSKALKDSFRISKCNGLLGSIYFVLGNVKETMNSAKKAIEGFEKLGIESELSNNFHNLAKNYRRIGKNEEAVEVINKALSISKKINDAKEVSTLYRALASIYQYLGRNDEVVEILEEQIIFCKKIGDKSGLANSYEIMGTAYRDFGNFDKALDCFNLFEKYANEAGSPQLISRALGSMALLLSIYKKHEKAIKLLYETAKIAKKINDRFTMSIAYGNIGAIYSELGKFDLALENINIHLKLSKEVGFKIGIGESLLILGIIYQKIGEFEKSLDHLRQSKEVLEPLGIQEKIANIIQVQAEVKKNQNELKESEDFTNSLIEIAKKTGLQIYLERALIHKAELYFLQNKLSEAKLIISEFEEIDNKNLDIVSQSEQILNQINFEEGSHESSISYFRSLLEKAKNEESEAQNHFHLTKLGVKSYELGTKILSLEEINSHKEKAISIYEKLYKGSPQYLYKSKIKELKTIVFNPQSINPQLLKSLVKWMNPETAFTEILNFLNEEYKANGCQIILKDEQTDKFESCAISPKLKDDELDFSSGILSEAIQKEEPILIEDATNLPRFKTNKSILGKVFLSVITVPLLTNKKICGALYLQRTKVNFGFFNRNDLKQIIEIAKILSPILQRQQEAVKHKIESQIRELGVFVGNSPKMQELYKSIENASKVNYPVYIHGETGTGKELVAGTLHKLSNRSTKPFVVINCATIPKDLAESELFGHTKGAFSGANSMKKGKFELSNGGTLFLDEIGELSLELQAKLLRAIQEKEIWRVGGEKAIKIDSRIIVATHRNLQEAVKKNKFREDLFHRLNVIKIEIPPLRERIEDIPLFANHFLEKICKEIGKKVAGFTSDSLILLQQQKWTGNVRELENTIAKGLVMKKNDLPLTSQELGLASSKSKPNFKKENKALPKSEKYVGNTLDEKLNYVVKEILIEELAKHNGSKTKTAISLNINREKLYRLLNKHKL